MTVTRNIGTAAASAAANTTALQNAMKQSRTDATEIVLGALAVFNAVSFEQSITDFPLTIRAADPAAPPIMEAIRFCGTAKDGFFNKIGSVPGATSLKDITIDGLHFVPTPLTQVRLGGDLSHGTYVLLDAPDGMAWRLDPTYTGFQDYTAKTAYMVAFIGFSGTQNLTIQNCYFRNYGRMFDISTANGLKLRHNTFEKWHEDCLFIGGGTNITIEYNLAIQCQPISQRDAFNGWGYGSGPTGTPPHSDWCQLYGKTTNFVYQYNEVYDDSERAHPLLMKVADGGPGGTSPVPPSQYHVNPRIINNFARSSHSTQWWFKYTTGLVCERNKGLRVTGVSANVSLQIDTTYCPSSTVRYNRAQKLNIGSSPSGWTVTGNVETNDPNDLGTGWVEFRRGMTAPGVPFAGQYGSVGDTPPTKPAGLTALQVAFGSLVQDPAFLDARRTFTGTIPAGSPARDAGEMMWSSDADTTVRSMTRLADAGANQVWRATSGGAAHLRNPGESFATAKFYYRATSGGLLSDPSTYTFTQAVPYSGDPDPLPTMILRYGDLRQAKTKTAAYASLATKADGIVWRKPC
jgi:hypothetical protein